MSQFAPEADRATADQDRRCTVPKVLAEIELGNPPFEWSDLGEVDRAAFLRQADRVLEAAALVNATPSDNAREVYWQAGHEAGPKRASARKVITREKATAAAGACLAKLVDIGPR